MSASRPSLVTSTLAARISLRMYPAWTATPAGYAEAVALVEQVLEHRRIVRPLSLRDLTEIVRLAEEMENE